MSKEVKRILEISYKRGLSHIGSCVTAFPIIQEIFFRKMPFEKFVLSNGHAALALYVYLEAKGGKNAEEIFAHHGVHPDRCADCGIDCSSGSLGHGLPIAVGMALADRTKNVYCLTSDGEWSEGSMWEALRIAEEKQLSNLKVYVNANGWGAYKMIHVPQLVSQLMLSSFWVQPKVVHTYLLDVPDFLRGQDAHYYVMNEKDYELAR